MIGQPPAAGGVGEDERRATASCRPSPRGSATIEGRNDERLERHRSAPRIRTIAVPARPGRFGVSAIGLRLRARMHTRDSSACYEASHRSTRRSVACPVRVNRRRPHSPLGAPFRVCRCSLHPKGILLREHRSTPCNTLSDADDTGRAVVRSISASRRPWRGGRCVRPSTACRRRFRRRPSHPAARRAATSSAPRKPEPGRRRPFVVPLVERPAHRSIARCDREGPHPCAPTREPSPSRSSAGPVASAAVCTLPLVRYGGASPTAPQVSALRARPSIVRRRRLERLVDHLDRRTLQRCRNVPCVPFLDEADRMLDMGFKPAARSHHGPGLPARRQTLALLGDDAARVWGRFAARHALARPGARRRRP